jgi:hypothetical protein
MECTGVFDIGCHLSNFATWLKDVLLWVPLKILALLLDGLAFVIESIPAPTFLAGLGTQLGQLPSGVVFFLDVFNVGTGVGIIFGAWILRFAIRRIPFVG